MAFECPHCGARNSEVQMGGIIPDKGVHFELRVEQGDTKVHLLPELLSRSVCDAQGCL